MIRLFLFLALVALAIEPAYAQFIGGGGGGGFDQFLQWLFQNVINGIIGLIIIFAGFMLARGHHEWAGTLAFAAAGIMIITHWQEIRGLFGQG